MSRQMSARVIIDESADVLWVELTQNAAEAIRFAAFVLMIVAAFYDLTPGAREAPGVLFAIFGIAAGWSIIALSGREVYVVDTSNGLIDVTASSPLGRYRKRIGVEDVGSVRLVTGGPDNDRLLVELVAPNGDPRVRLPRRLTTLSARDQLEVARVFAERLEVPLRGTQA